MLSIWQLPVKACFGHTEYDIHGDFRDILEIISYLNEESLPQWIRWQIALGLFYEQPVPREHQSEALAYLCRFISGGNQWESKPGPKLMDWQLDAEQIVADINKAAHQEIRMLPFVHWWTFLSWFHAITEGQLSTLVGIRNKLRRGQKLEKWERDFYRENKNQVDMRKPLTEEERAEKHRLEQLLS